MKWIYRRLLIAFLSIFITVLLTFFLIRLMPGNPMDAFIQVLIRSGRARTREEALQRAKSLMPLNMDDPLWKQLIDYVSGVLRGDLGRSISSFTPVTDIIIQSLPWTVFVSSFALAISFSIGTVLGLVLAYKRGSKFEGFSVATLTIFGAIPNYIMALILFYVFTVVYPIFPMRGAYDSTIKPGLTFDFISSIFRHAILPIASYVLTDFSGWALGIRAMATTILGEDYITVAKARGLRGSRIVTSYVGRNSILPQFTGLVLSIGFMFGGSPLVETIFTYPGIGRFFAAAVSARDYPLLQGLFLMLSTTVISANLVADILYTRIDPRVRMGD
ncbi:MAG: ABC transporter permease [Thermoproteota archaeon]